MLCVKKLSESPWRNTTKQNKRERCDKNMKNMTLANIAKAVNGSLHNAEQHVGEEAAGVVLDSRKVEAGYVFIATKGERVDGHTFIDAVFEKGALGVICEKAPKTQKEHISL